jgi:hypothetical protein
MRPVRARLQRIVFVSLIAVLAAHSRPVAASTPHLKSSMGQGKAQLKPIVALQSIRARDAGAAAEIFFENIGLSGAETGADDLEVTLRFDGPLDGAQTEKLAVSLPRWIAYATPGYDSLLIRTKKKAAFAVTREGTGVVVRIAWAADPGSAARENMQRLRYLTMTGETAKARALISDLRRLSPDPARLDRAEAELRIAERDLRGGLALYDQLASANPDDIGLRRSVAELRSQLSDVIEANLSRQSVEDGDTQTRAMLRGRAEVGPNSALRAEIETVTLSDDTVLRSDGAIIAFDETKARLRASYDVESNRGVIWSSVLHGAAHGVGLGGEIVWRGANREFALRSAYQEPFFGFVESIANDGSRSYVEASLQLRGSRAWSAGATIGYNIYDLNGVDEAATSAALDVFARYETPELEGATLVFAYALDAEYVGSVALRTDAFDVAFTPLPISDREVHSLGLGLNAGWDNGLTLDAMAGYSYDRYAEGGFFARASIDYALNDAWRAYMNASYAEVNARGTGGGAVTSGSLGLTYRFGAPGAAFGVAKQGNGS